MELCYLCGGDGLIDIGRELDEKLEKHGVLCPACLGHKTLLIETDFYGLPISKRMIGLDTPPKDYPTDPGV